MEETILVVTHAMQKIALCKTILGAFNIKYIFRGPVMGQVLTDQMVDIAEPSPVEMTEAQHVNGKLVGTVSLHGILCPERRMLIALQIKR